MGVLFLFAMIGLIFFLVNQGGGAKADSSGVHGETLAHRPSAFAEESALWSEEYDGPDLMNDPTYSGLPGNIYYSSSEDIGMEIYADESTDNMFDEDSLPDMFDTGDCFASENIYTDIDYFWMEGNIYHTDMDDCGLSTDDSFASCTDDSMEW